MEFWAPAPGIPAGSDGIFPLFQPLRVKVPEQFLTDIGECGIPGILAGKGARGRDWHSQTPPGVTGKLGISSGMKGTPGTFPTSRIFPNSQRAASGTAATCSPAWRALRNPFSRRSRGSSATTGGIPKCPEIPGKPPRILGIPGIPGAPDPIFLGFFFRLSRQNQADAGIGEFVRRERAPGAGGEFPAGSAGSGAAGAGAGGGRAAAGAPRGHPVSAGNGNSRRDSGPAPGIPGCGGSSAPLLRPAGGGVGIWGWEKGGNGIFGDGEGA